MVIYRKSFLTPEEQIRSNEERIHNLGGRAEEITQNAGQSQSDGK